MISPALLATLTNLKNNRLLSGEAKSALAPFTGKTFTLPLAFVSASRTFGNPFDPAYDDGHTLICRIEGEEIEVTVLLGAEENDRIDSLASDETFEAKLTALDFDALYQRAIFGQLLAPLTVSEEQEEVTEEPQTQILEKPETLPPPTSADESLPPLPFPAEIPQTEPEETPQPTNDLEREESSREAEIEIPTPVAPPPPPPRPFLSDNIAEEDDLAVENCPNGHGPLEPMAGKMICWTCGWPEHKQSSTTSTDSSKPNRLQKKPGQEKEPAEEKQGCSGCRIILGASFLLIGLASCKSGGYSSGGFVFTILGLVCYWPLMKKKFLEGLS